MEPARFELELDEGSGPVSPRYQHMCQLRLAAEQATHPEPQLYRLSFLLKRPGATRIEGFVHMPATEVESWFQRLDVAGVYQLGSDEASAIQSPKIGTRLNTLRLRDGDRKVDRRFLPSALKSAQNEAAEHNLVATMAVLGELAERCAREVTLQSATD